MRVVCGIHEWQVTTMKVSWWILRQERSAPYRNTWLPSTTICWLTVVVAMCIRSFEKKTNDKTTWATKSIKFKFFGLLPARLKMFIERKRASVVPSAGTRLKIVDYHYLIWQVVPYNTVLSLAFVLTIHNSNQTIDWILELNSIGLAATVLRERRRMRSLPSSRMLSCISIMLRDDGREKGKGKRAKFWS